MVDTKITRPNQVHLQQLQQVICEWIFSSRQMFFRKKFPRVLDRPRAYLRWGYFCLATQFYSSAAWNANFGNVPTLGRFVLRRLKANSCLDRANGFRKDIWSPLETTTCCVRISVEDKRLRCPSSRPIFHYRNDSSCCSYHRMLEDLPQPRTSCSHVATLPVVILQYNL